jgi:hypothetical protein
MPTETELRAASTGALLAPLRSEIDRAVAEIRSTRRGRFAWRLARAYARLHGRP